MNIKKLLKVTAINCGVYALLNASFQYGKGYVLRKMKKHNLTVDEVLAIVKRDSKNGPLDKRINNKIIDATATSPW